MLPHRRAGLRARSAYVAQRSLQQLLRQRQKLSSIILQQPRRLAQGFGLPLRWWRWSGARRARARLAGADRGCSARRTLRLRLCAAWAMTPPRWRARSWCAALCAALRDAVAPHWRRLCLELVQRGRAALPSCIPAGDARQWRTLHRCMTGTVRLVVKDQNNRVVRFNVRRCTKYEKRM
jgi:hypothetical protein